MSEQDKISGCSTVKGIFHSSRENCFDKILTPFDEFIPRQTPVRLLLMGIIIPVLFYFAFNFDGKGRVFVCLFPSCGESLSNDYRGHV